MRNPDKNSNIAELRQISRENAENQTARGGGAAERQRAAVIFRKSIDDARASRKKGRHESKEADAKEEKLVNYLGGGAHTRCCTHAAVIATPENVPYDARTS